MKTHLNLTIDKAILEQVKDDATKNYISISEIVESHLKRIGVPAKRKNIVEMIDELKKPAIDERADLKKEFYGQQKKYGL
jgi:hypothetical protein